ncbi:MAG: sigma-70 family RNA polymerase sigma factor [Planctomycetaceae bacterium]
MSVTQICRRANRGTDDRPLTSTTPGRSDLIAPEISPRVEAESLSDRATRLMLTEISFVYSSDFEANERADEDAELVQRLVGELDLFRKESSGSEKSLIGSLKHSLEVPLLSPEEEQALFRYFNRLRHKANSLRSSLKRARPSRKSVEEIERLLADSCLARERILASNTRLVVSQARKQASTRQEFEEFVSEGMLILVGAVDKFDYSRGFRFSTYATHSLTRHFYRCWQRSQKRRERYVTTPTEVLSNVVESAPANVPDPEETQLMNHVMEHASDRLDSRERKILSLRFGLDGRSEKTLREVAGLLGLSKERVRQVQMRALKKLKQLADEWRPQTAMA